MNHDVNKRIAGSSQVKMFVLDVLRHDVETIPSIVTILNDTGCIGWRSLWPHDFTLEEVVPAVEQLLSEGMVQALREHEARAQLVPTGAPGNVWENLNALWFALTKKGRQAWEQWNPPEEPSGPAQRSDSNGIDREGA